MNKLVSKNPVQRFKQGRKIVKAEDGDVLRYNTLYTGKNGNSYMLDPDRGWIMRRNGITSFVTSPIRIHLNGNNYLINGKKTSFIKPTDTTTKSKGTSGTSGTGMSYQFGKMGGWNRFMGEGTIKDQESLNMLKEMGMEGKSAQEVQNEINKAFGSNAVKSDNRWGNQSRKGLAALYERWKSLNPQIQQPINTPFQKEIQEKIKTPEVQQEMKNLLTQESFEEYPQLQNDQQIMNNSQNFTNTLYRSVGPYEQGNSSVLKDYGIKDYNSLVNYVKNNPNAYISTDLTNTFGDVNNWNQQNFENQIGIGGHYGRMNRNALWGYLNGLKQKYNSLTPQKLGWMALKRQGGQLVSRNPIKRFKNRK